MKDILVLTASPGRICHDHRARREAARLPDYRVRGAIDFVISDQDIAALRDADDRTDYSEAGAFPVFGKKRQVVGADS